MSRPLTLGLLLCLAGFGAGVGIAQLSGSSPAAERVATTVRTTQTAPSPARAEVLLAAAPLPDLGSAPKRRVVRRRTITRQQPAAPVAPPQPVVVPRPPLPPPPPPPPPKRPKTETAKPLHG